MSYSWSYSAYSTAASCLRKFKYAYLDKIVPEGPESGDLIFGSALHSAINAALIGEDGVATFDLYWNTYKDKGVEYGRYKWNDLYLLGQKFLKNFTGRHAHKFKFFFAEQRLYGEYRGVAMEGTPDYYGLYEGKKSLRDFKTSGQNYKPEKKDCALQLYMYAHLLLQNFPEYKIDTLGYTVFNKGTGTIQDLTWDFDPQAMEAALEEFHLYTQIWGVPTEAYPGNHGACLDYNRKCQYYDKCHTKKEEK